MMDPKERRRQMRYVYLTWVYLMVDSHERITALEETRSIYLLINNALQSLARQEPHISTLREATKRTYAFEVKTHAQLIARLETLEILYPWLIRPYAMGDRHPVRTVRLFLTPPEVAGPEQGDVSQPHLRGEASTGEDIRISFPVLQDALSSLIVLLIDFDAPLS